MREIMKEIWHGNIVPQTDFKPQTSEHEQLTEYILRHKNDLLITLNDEQLEIFDKLDSCFNEYVSMNNEAIFSYAFKLGMRVATEAFTEDFNNDL